MNSSRHDPYKLGHTRVTKIIYKKKQKRELEQIFKNYLSSDYRLKFAYMKLESLVIVDQRATVNIFLSFAQTARHVMEIT